MSKPRIIKKHVYDALGQDFDAFFSEDQFVESHKVARKNRELAKTIKEQAQEEAQEIIQEAKKQAMLEQQSAYEEGLRRGLEKIAPLEGQLMSLSEELKGFMDSYPERLESRIVALVMNIAHRIIKDKLTTDREIVVRNVQEAFKELTDKEEIKIRVHADDLKIMQEFQGRLLQSFHEIRRLEIVADDSIDRGGAIIETNEGSIDATIRTQMQQLYKVLMVDGPK